MSSTVSREPRSDRQFWLTHVSRWQQSGLSKAAYCEKHALKTGSFYNWSRPKRSGSSATPACISTASSVAATAAPALSFMPVSVKPAEPLERPRMVHVQRAATEVTLPGDLSAEQMQHWLAAIHRLHV